MTSRIIHGDCIDAMQCLDAGSVGFILTDPPYLVNYRDRSGRAIINDQEGDWLKPAFAQMHRVLRRNAFCVSFYGYTKIDLFMDAWKSAGFRVVGHFVFPKKYTSSSYHTNTGTSRPICWPKAGRTSPPVRRRTF